MVENWFPNRSIRSWIYNLSATVGGGEVEENSIEGRNSLKLSLQDKLTAKETTNYGI